MQRTPRERRGWQSVVTGAESLILLLAQFGQPFPEGFGRSADEEGAPLAGAGVEEAEVGLFIRTVQAEDQVIGVRCGRKLHPNPACALEIPFLPRNSS